MLNGVLCDSVDSINRGDTGLGHLVVALSKVIRDYRCRIIFEREAFVFVETIFKDLIGSE